MRGTIKRRRSTALFVLLIDNNNRSAQAMGVARGILVLGPPILHYANRPCLKKRPTFGLLYNFDTHEWISIFFGRNVTDKVGNQKTLYYATPSNLCFCTTWQNWETRKSHFSPNWTVLHAQCTCALSFWKKNVICDVFDSV